MTLTLAISIYLLIQMSLLFLLWFHAEGEGLREIASPEGKEFLWRCHICTFVYIDSRHDELSRCPQCGSFNERKEAYFDSLKK